MTQLRLSLFTCALLFVSVALCSTAKAQNRVFVSGTGDDLNPCTRISPCRNFQRGHDAVVAGGEVVALDSAGYGKLVITKSLTITGDGVYAGITASSGSGVTIATSGITVNLRGLTIEGSGSGDRGINATNFTTLHIESCIVNRFAFDGILVNPATAGTRKVFIIDSISRNNGTNGITVNNNQGTVLVATVEDTWAENNGIHGFVIGGGATVTARGCSTSGNSMNGFQLQLGGLLNIESSVASNNGSDGIYTVLATLRVSNSTVTNNGGFGLHNDNMNPGIFESRGNNTVAGNNGGGAQTSGGITPITGT